jgi:hypothetical protein
MAQAIEAEDRLLEGSSSGFAFPTSELHPTATARDRRLGPGVVECLSLLLELIEKHVCTFDLVGTSK